MSPPTLRRERLALLALAAFVFATRLPFLGPGYGRDEDAWRLADASRRIATSGEYVFSRAPGYPLPEYVGALFWRGGPLALNALSALACALASVLIAALLLRTRPRAAFPTALAFAFTPVVYIASCAAMDYHWGLAFALGAWLAALRGRPLVAGISMGLAIAARPAVGVLLLPVALLALRARGMRAALMTCVMTLLVAGLCFTPVLLTYELEQLAPSRMPWSLDLAALTTMLGVRSFGRPGTIAMLLAFVLVGVDLVRSARRAPDAEARAFERALLLGLSLALAVFVWMPYEEGYLVTSVAFLLMLVTPRLPVLAAWALAGAMAFSSFVDLRGFSPARGPILVEHRVREHELLRMDEIRAAARALDPPVLIVAGTFATKLRCLLESDKDGDVQYQFVLRRPQAKRMRDMGQSFYYLDDIADWHAEMTGVSLPEVGALPLFGQER